MCNRHKLQIMLLLLTVYWRNEAARSSLRTFVKLKNLRCRATVPQLISFEHCGIVQQDNVTLVQTLCHISERPVTRLTVRLQAFKKRSVGFAPFIIDLTVDWCDFLEKRNVPLVERLFSIFEHYSNLNTKCPVNIEYTYVNVSLPLSAGFRIPFKFPTGDYRLDITITANATAQLLSNAYFQIT